MRLLTLFILFLAGTLYACGGKKEAEKKPMVAAPAAGNSTDSIVDAYIKMKDAFVSDRIEKVDSALQVFSGSLQLDSNLLRAMSPAGQQVVVSLKEQVSGMITAKDMEAKRQLFRALITPMRTLAAAGSSMTLYEQHCPMAFNDEGASWLSYETKIKNPYLPKTMLRCGRVDDTLNRAR
jgi:Cu(I)/Ag(I) efflux system membrane fusion protein